MLIGLLQNFEQFLRDLVVLNLNAWTLVGVVGQTIFGLRFIVQWLASERAGRTVIPLSFWLLSIAGSAIVLIYGIHKREPVVILSQLMGLPIYFRNLALIAKERRARGKVAIEGDG